MPEMYYTVAEVAAALKVKPGTVYQYLKCGKLKGIKLGSSRRAAVRIEKASLENLLAECAVIAGGEV